MLSRFSFQAAKVNQKIKEERMNIDIVDRIKQIEIQENEIERRRKELGRQRQQLIELRPCLSIFPCSVQMLE